MGRHFAAPCYALFFADIHAFEPHPETYKTLLRHISLNDRQGVITPHNVGASSREGEMFMDDLSHGGAKVAATRRQGATAAGRTNRLDSVLDFAGRNIAVKMDVEGHESEALDGMRNLLSRNRVLLQVEIFPKNIGVICRLMESGFRPVNAFKNDYHFVNDGDIVDEIIDETERTSEARRRARLASHR